MRPLPADDGARRPLGPMQNSSSNHPGRPRLGPKASSSSINTAAATATPPPLKARVNLSESLADQPPNKAPFPTSNANNNSPGNSSFTPTNLSRLRSSSPQVTPVSNPSHSQSQSAGKRIKSPLTDTSAAFPSSASSTTTSTPIQQQQQQQQQHGSRYTSPSLPAQPARGFTRSVVSPVARSALSPEASPASLPSAANSSTAASNPPLARRAVKASTTNPGLLPAFNNNNNNNSNAHQTHSSPPSVARTRSPSPVRRAASPNKVPAKASSKPAVRHHLATPPVVNNARHSTAPPLRTSASTSSLNRPAHAPWAASSSSSSGNLKASVSMPQEDSSESNSRKVSSASSSSSAASSTAHQGPSLSPNPGLGLQPPPSRRSNSVSSASGLPPRSGGGGASSLLSSPMEHASFEERYGPSPSDVLDEEDMKEIERAKEREKKAKENRKILDLEITNASLLAINATLEKSKQKQTGEISSLRRKLREGQQFLPSPLPTSPGMSSTSSLGGLADVGDPAAAEEEEDWATLLSQDPEFGYVARCLENLVDQGQSAVSASSEDVHRHAGTKVVSRFENSDDLDPDEDSSFADDSILGGLNPSAMSPERGLRAKIPPSRMRIASLTSNSDTATDAPLLKPSTAPADAANTSTDSSSHEMSHITENSENSEPEAWTSGISSPTSKHSRNSSKSSSIAPTRTQSTPQSSIPASPSAGGTAKRPASSSAVAPSTFASPSTVVPSDTPSSASSTVSGPSLTQSPSQGSGAMSTMASFLGWSSPQLSTPSGP